MGILGKIRLHYTLRHADDLVAFLNSDIMRAASGWGSIVPIHAGQVIEFLIINPIQPNLYCLNLTIKIAVGNHNARPSDVQSPLSSLFLAIESRDTIQNTATL